jgi:hypothetical protein
MPVCFDWEMGARCARFFVLRYPQQSPGFGFTGPWQASHS